MQQTIQRYQNLLNQLVRLNLTRFKDLSELEARDADDKDCSVQGF